MNKIEANAAQEFDRWAASGRAESMERGHTPMVSSLLDQWSFDGTDRVLDVGCGNGWVVREMCARGAGHGVGVDISAGMIACAQQRVSSNITYSVASAENLPFDAGTFSAITSVESLYYYANPSAALAEWRRVSREGGRLGVAIDLYEDSPVGRVWSAVLDVPVHVLSEADWVEQLQQAGWRNIRTWRVLDSSPIMPQSDFKPSRYWPDYETYIGFRRAGSLVLAANS